MLNLPVILISAFLIGCFEWILAILRVQAVLSHCPSTVALTVFLEVYLALAVSLVAIKKLSTIKALIVFGVYALGGALGSVLPLL